jgi:hypothetical protein
MKRDLRAAEVHDFRQGFFTSVFPNLAAQHNFQCHLSTPYVIATSFPPALSRRFAILIALGQSNKNCYAHIGNK